MFAQISEKTEARIFAQVLVLGLALSYVLLGALVFSLIDEYTDHDAKSKEPDTYEALHTLILQSFRCKDTEPMSLACEDLVASLKMFMPDSSSNSTTANKTAIRVEPRKWTYAESVLYVFTLITTIGYGNIVPGTEAGKIFTMVYGIVGIPVGMLVIANVGKFVAEGVREAIVISHGLMRRKRSHVAGKLLERSVFAIGLAEGAELPLGDPYKQEKLSLPALFILFVVYIALGTLILPCYENMSFFTASYFAFISITTVGFGDVSPKEMRYLVPTLLYITCGLAVTTIALDLSSDFLRKLHHMGKKLADVRYTLIHFGSKTLCVGELVSAVGHTFKIPPADINRALGRLDELVVRTIDEKENPEKYRVYMELVDNPEVVFKLTEKLDFAEKDCEEIDA